MIVRYALDCGTRVLAPRKRGELAPIMRSYLGTRASGPPITPPQAGRRKWPRPRADALLPGRAGLRLANESEGERTEPCLGKLLSKDAAQCERT